MLQVMQHMNNKHQIEQLATDYEFTGSQSLKIHEAIEVKEELEKIEQLLKQLEEARETAQIGLIDLDLLAEYAPPSDMQQLEDAAAGGKLVEGARGAAGLGETSRMDRAFD